VINIFIKLNPINTELLDDWIDKMTNVSINLIKPLLIKYEYDLIPIKVNNKVKSSNESEVFFKKIAFNLLDHLVKLKKKSKKL
jgi:predicted KAP-like P-loop ATPase